MPLKTAWELCRGLLYRYNELDTLPIFTFKIKIGWHCSLVLINSYEEKYPKAGSA